MVRMHLLYRHMAESRYQWSKQFLLQRHLRLRNCEFAKEKMARERNPKFKWTTFGMLRYAWDAEGKLNSYDMIEQSAQSI